MSNKNEVVLHVQLASSRVQRFLCRELWSPVWRWTEVGDPRRRRDGRSKVVQNLGPALLGLVAGSRSLREVEALSGVAPGRRLFRATERVPDTMLYRCLKRTEPADVREVLVRHVRQLQRRGA